MAHWPWMVIVALLGAGMPSCGGCGGQSLAGESVDGDMTEDGARPAWSRRRMIP